MAVQFNGIVLEDDDTEVDRGDDEEFNTVKNAGGWYSYVVIGTSKHRGLVLKSKIKNLAFTDVFRCAK